MITLPCVLELDCERMLRAKPCLVPVSALWAHTTSSKVDHGYPAKATILLGMRWRTCEAKPHKRLRIGPKCRRNFHVEARTRPSGRCLEIDLASAMDHTSLALCRRSSTCISCSKSRCRLHWLIRVPLSVWGVRASILLARPLAAIVAGCALPRWGLEKKTQASGPLHDAGVYRREMGIRLFLCRDATLTT